MSEVKKLIKGVQACEKFAKQLELHDVKIDELEALGDISRVFRKTSSSLETGLRVV